MASGTPPGRGRASRARYGRIRKLADRLAGKNMLTPRKLRNWIRWRLDARYSLCSVRRILRLLGFSSKRSATMYASAAGADVVRQWQAGATDTISGGKKARIYDRGARRVHISQNGDERKEAVVARWGSSDC